jgi:DNA-binding MarR family transcriptional regulator
MVDVQTFNDLMLEVSCLSRLGISKTSAIRAESELGSRERAILAELDTGLSMTIPRLARATMTTRQNVRVIINRLLARGMVRLTINPDHRKSHFVEITDAGAGALETSLRFSQKFVLERLGSMAESEVRHALECIRTVRELMTGSVSVPKGETDRTAEVGRSPEEKHGEHTPRRKKSDAPYTEQVQILETVDSELPVNLL